MTFVSSLAALVLGLTRCDDAPCDGEGPAPTCGAVAGEWSGRYTVTGGEFSGFSGRFAFTIAEVDARCTITGDLGGSLASTDIEGFVCGSTEGEVTLTNALGSGRARLTFDGDTLTGTFEATIGENELGVAPGGYTGEVTGTRSASPPGEPPPPPPTPPSPRDSCPSSCADGNPCTDDTCDPAAGCMHAPNTVPCDDGDACTDGDACSGGTCQPGTPIAGCEAPSCGDDVCRAGEDCESCTRDCDGRSMGAPSDRFCCGNGVLESAEGDGTLCGGNP